QAYSNAIQHQSHLTGKFLDTRLGFEQKNISNTVRKQMTNTELSSSPNFDHPVVRNQLNSIADSLALANPDWHPKQVADAAKQYITDLAGALNPNAGKDTENKD